MVKNILLIGTGGTIASKPSENGLTPDINSKELLSYLDDMSEICKITAIQLLNLDSTNMNCANWLEIAKCIKDNYDLYDGFVITHGTDTMAYTAAALSYLIQNSYKPIVLTGSQKSIFMRDSDARSNLSNAFIYASNDKANGVHIVFDGRIIMGTRAKKNRTKSYNAFSSVNYPEIGIIRDNKVIYFIESKYNQNEVKFYDKLDPNVFVLKLIPGMDLNIFSYLKEHYDVVIVESFGVGGLPMYEEEDFSKAIEDLLNANVSLVITTQVPYEGSDLALYKVGKKVKDKYELLEAYDMTIESLVAKMMWIRSITDKHDEIKEMLYTSIYNDINL